MPLRVSKIATSGASIEATASQKAARAAPGRSCARHEMARPASTRPAAVYGDIRFAEATNRSMPRSAPPAYSARVRVPMRIATSTKA